MKKAFYSKLLFLFIRNKAPWDGKIPLQTAVYHNQYRRLTDSLKALFWIAISIICGLLIGQLN